MKIDHLVLNVGRSYQKDGAVIKTIRRAGFPYLPESGMRTKGLKRTEIRIGQEYLELARLLRPSCGNYKKEWCDAYNRGHRGLICLLLQTEDLDKTYHRLSSQYVPVTKPERVGYRWFFNLFVRTLPQRVSYIPLFFGVPMQIGIMERTRLLSSDAKKPNSIERGIKGISKVVVEGPFTDGDLKLAAQIFPEATEEPDQVTVTLEKDQHLVFCKGRDYRVDVHTDCRDDSLNGKSVVIENVTLSVG